MNNLISKVFYDNKIMRYLLILHTFQKWRYLIKDSRTVFDQMKLRRCVSNTLLDIKVEPHKDLMEEFEKNILQRTYFS